MARMILVLGALGLLGIPVFGDQHTALKDLTVPNWNVKPAVFPAPADEGTFVPDADEETTAYRQGLLSVGPEWKGPIWHHMGSLELKLKTGASERLGVNVFEPTQASRGVMLFVHGYTARAADFPFTLAWFASRGWVVVTIDLPGHGLSEGSRYDIDTFTTYGDSVALWLDWVARQHWPGPRVLIAHSLGAAATLEALRRPGAPSLDKIIFCAPLLRTTWYPGLVVADALVGGWFTGMLSADTQARAHWFSTLEDWLQTLDHQPPLSLPLTIYAGDRDSVVDVGWNREKFRTLVPQANWITLPGKDHWFLSDPDDRLEFHQRLEADLKAEGF